jgi:hypothetical protein
MDFMIFHLPQPKVPEDGLQFRGIQMFGVVGIFNKAVGMHFRNVILKTFFVLRTQ